MSNSADEKKKVPLEKRAQRAMLQNAVFRWESAVVIALTLVLSVLGPQYVPLVPGWAWLLGGALAELAVVYSSYTDPETGRRVVANMLRDEFQPQRLKDERLRQQVAEAMDYRSRIAAAIRERRDSVLKDNLAETAVQIDEWIESVCNLAARLDRYQREKGILERDRGRVAQRIQQLRSELQHEDDAAGREQMSETLTGMQRQLATIELLDNTMDRARLQLESTLSSLGTIYAQTMLVGAKDIDSGRARRLRQEIAEEVEELDNILLAMDEVYSSEGSAGEESQGPEGLRSAGGVGPR
jgi:hypothetical protein